MSNPNPAHRPAGTPDGGQFAKTSKSEPVDVPELDDDEDENCAGCGEPLADSEGEGYDGLCGTCADKAEAEGRWG